VSEPVRAPLVVRGWSWAWLIPAFAIPFGVGLLALGFLVALSQLGLPWTPANSSALLWREPVVPLSVLAFLLGASHSLAKSLFVRRSGHVELSDKGVVFRRRGLLTRRLAWKDLEAYSDAHTSSIDIIRRGRRLPRPGDAIPAGEEAARTAVLGVLDTHGLHRVEGTRAWGSLVRASVVGGACALLVVFLIYFENARRRKFEALAAGTLSSADAAALVSESVAVQVVVRKVIGAEDGFDVEVACRAPPVVSLSSYPERWADGQASTRIEIDGRDVMSGLEKSPEVGGPMPFLLHLPAANFDLAHDADALWSYPIPPSVHHLSPGRHSVCVVTRLKIDSGECLKETLTELEVVPGSLVSTLRPARGDRTYDSCWVEASPTGCMPGFRLWAPLACTTAVRIDVVEGDNPLTSGRYLVRARHWQTVSEWQDVLMLARGHHVLKLRFTPDPRFAFERDADATDFLADTFEHEVTVDVP
jgi:hypothetical protein